MDWPSNQGQFHLSKILILFANISKDCPLSHSYTVRHAEYEAKPARITVYIVDVLSLWSWASVSSPDDQFVFLLLDVTYSNQRHPVFGSALSPLLSPLLYTCPYELNFVHLILILLVIVCRLSHACMSWNLVQILDYTSGYCPQTIPFGLFWRLKKIGHPKVTFALDTTLLEPSRTLTLRIQQAGAKIVHETNFLVP